MSLLTRNLNPPRELGPASFRSVGPEKLRLTRFRRLRKGLNPHHDLTDTRLPVSQERTSIRYHMSQTRRK